MTAAWFHGKSGGVDCVVSSVTPLTRRSETKAQIVQQIRAVGSYVKETRSVPHLPSGRCGRAFRIPSGYSEAGAV